MEPSNPENKNNQPEEHETHTTALVFLVIASLIIAYIALTYSGDISSTPGEDDQTPATTSEATSTGGIALGSTVPQSKVDSTESNDLSSLPSDLYIEEESITENKKLDTGNQIIRFTTERSLSDLYDEYRTWTEESQYEVIHEVNNEDGIKVVGSSDAGQITFSATRSDEGNQVSISHVLFE